MSTRPLSLKYLVGITISCIVAYALILGLVNGLTDLSTGCKVYNCTYVPTNYSPYSWQIYGNGAYLCTCDINIPTNGTRCYDDNWSTCPLWSKCSNWSTSIFMLNFNIFFGLLGGLGLILLIEFTINEWRRPPTEEQTRILAHV